MHSESSFLKFFIIFIFMYLLRAFMWVWACYVVHMKITWQLVALGFLVHYIEPWDWTKVISFKRKNIYLLNHLNNPLLFHFFKNKKKDMLLFHFILLQNIWYFISSLRILYMFGSYWLLPWNLPWSTLTPSPTQLCVPLTQAKSHLCCPHSLRCVTFHYCMFDFSGSVLL